MAARIGAAPERDAALRLGSEAHLRLVAERTAACRRPIPPFRRPGLKRAAWIINEKYIPVLF
jgi:hypothetical protein